MMMMGTEECVVTCRHPLISVKTGGDRGRQEETGGRTVCPSHLTPMSGAAPV